VVAVTVVVQQYKILALQILVAAVEDSQTKELVLQLEPKMVDQELLL
jgi:hypothetical protein